MAAAIASGVESGERVPGDFLVLFRTRTYMSDYARALESRGIPYALSAGGAFATRRSCARFCRSCGRSPTPMTPSRAPRFCAASCRCRRRRALPARARRGSVLLPRAAAGGSRPAHRPRVCPSHGVPGAIDVAAAGGGHLAHLGSARLHRSRRGARPRGQPRGETAAGHRRRADAVRVGARLHRRGRRAVPADREGLDRGDERRTGTSRCRSADDGPRRERAGGARGLPRRPEAPAELSGPLLDKRGESARGHWRTLRETDNFGVVEIAEPSGWDEMEETECAFEEAEKMRLLYVAATRARESLVVSVFKQGKSDNPQGPWLALDPRLRDEFSPRRRLRTTRPHRPRCEGPRRSATASSKLWRCAGREALPRLRALVRHVAHARRLGEAGLGIDGARHVMGPGPAWRA